MLNINKCILFVIDSILYLITLCVNAEHKIIITILYIIFILVGLYDLGYSQLEEEKTKEIK